MELAAAAVSSIASGISSVASSVGSALGITGAAGAGASSVGLGSLAFGVLSGGATVASMLAQERKGRMERDALLMEAEDQKLVAGQEAVQGEERRSSIKQALLETIGERDAAYAASGVDLSFGTPVEARAAAVDDAERALSMDQDNQEFRRLRLMQRADNLRFRARAARKSASALAGIEGLEGAASIIRRG